MYELNDHQSILWYKFKNQELWNPGWQNVPNVSPTLMSKAVWLMLASDWNPSRPQPSEIGTGWVNLIVDEMHGLPEVKTLHRRIESDPWATSVAHGVLMNRLGKSLPPWTGVVKPESMVREELEGLNDLKRQGVAITSVLGGITNALGVLKQESQRFMSEVTWKLPEIRNAIRSACEECVEELDRLALVEGTLGGGWGIGKGGIPTPAEIERRHRRADMIRERSYKLNRIMEMAGRMLRVADRAQKSKMDATVGEIVGVQFSDDIEQALPEEIARMVMGGNIATTFWVDFVERSLMNYQCQERVPMAKGPVVYLVDESGSMAGEREEWAKAIAIVLASICRKQKRNLVIGTFEDRIKLVFESDGGEITDEILGWLSSKIGGGGTRYEPALDWAVKTIMEDNEKMKQADIIFVTDDECGVGDVWLNEWRLKKQDPGFPNVIGLGIDCSVDSLTTICHSVEKVNTDAIGAETAFLI